MARFSQVNGELVPFTSAEETARDAEEAAWLADTDKRNAQSVLERYDARGFTRAWESAIAPIEDDLGEYDATVLAEKKAARAVVEG